MAQRVVEVAILTLDGDRRVHDGFETLVLTRGRSPFISAMDVRLPAPPEQDRLLRLFGENHLDSARIYNVLMGPAKHSIALLFNMIEIQRVGLGTANR